MKKAGPKKRKGKCPRAFTHRPDVYCKTCDTTPKERGV